MTRRGTLLAAGLAAAAGCSDKPRPIREAKEVRQSGADASVDLPTEAAPATSDPAAAKVVADAIAAHTGGRPDRLDKLRSVDLTRTGTILALDPPPKTTWRIRAAWPDRYRMDVEMADGPKLVFTRVGDTGWRAALAPGATKEVLSAVNLKGVIADATYEWLALLAPLADSGLIVAPAPDATFGGRPAAGVRLGGKTLPRAVAHFDKETKLLAHFAYEGNEAGSPIHKEVRVGGVREFHGVKLPDKLTIKMGGRPAAEWSVTTVEFPVELPAKLFEEP
jgi:hypothetical protein